ncbi:hypothetical protein PACTADRAFT_36068 [Pachysolen tannophilus NRRL Y-2460]|uniref:Protein SOP4 n=1 Tax=Pachysolen tannophilus NRRL Y-2460 TaxID=669874 RepID=A0A1E4TNY3_PACTA|nr:hypothetical protein PACTADRAFT_36068 [Pachysolen tannophilus NRRL Y-2460]
MLRVLIVIFVFLVSSSLGFEINGRIELPLLATGEPDYTITSRTRIELLPLSKYNDNNNKKILHGSVLKDGSFHIPDVNDLGSYQLVISSLDYHFLKNRFKIDIGDKTISAYEFPIGSEYTTTIKTSYPILITKDSLIRRNYIEQRSKSIIESISRPISIILNNRIYLACAVLILLTALLPTLINYLDPEFNEKVKDLNTQQQSLPPPNKSD